MRIAQKCRKQIAKRYSEATLNLGDQENNVSLCEGASNPPLLAVGLLDQQPDSLLTLSVGEKHQQRVRGGTGHSRYGRIRQQIE
jgi:hypothetical protein